MERKIKKLGLAATLTALALASFLFTKTSSENDGNKKSLEQKIETTSPKQKRLAENDEINYAVEDFSLHLRNSRIIFPLGHRIKESMNISPYAGGFSYGQIITSDANLISYFKTGETNSRISMALSLGADSLGNPRNLEDTLNSDPDKISISQSWANKEKYPPKTSKEEAERLLQEFIKSYVDTETRKYLLEESREVVFNGNQLPFYRLIYTPSAYLKNKSVPRPELQITIRTAGADLQNGEIAITRFNFPGFVFPEVKPSKPPVLERNIPQL